MSLFITNTITGGGHHTTTSTTNQHHHHHRRSHILFPQTSSSSPRTRPVVLVKAKKVSSSSRIGKFDSKNKRNTRGGTTTTTEDEQEEEKDRTVEIEQSGDGGVVEELPFKLPGEEPDFWEGEQWEALGFFVQYLWAFGIVFAVIAIGVAVATYNEGATDFKETPAYKESIQSRELFEEPEALGTDVFESNPTEVAPTLE